MPNKKMKGTKKMKGSKQMKKMAKSVKKRVASAWNVLVKKVYAREKKNGKSFKDCLIMASKENKKSKV